MSSAGPYPRLPGRWDDLIIVWGSVSWDRHRLGSQSLAAALAEHHPVLYVDPPVSVTRLARERRLVEVVRSPRLDLLAPGLARLSPLAPPGARRLGYRDLAAPWLRRPLQRAVDALGGSVRAVLSGWVAYNPFGLCGERTRVFRVSDDFTAGAGLAGIGTDPMRQAELRLAEMADLVVCVSPVLAEKWRALGFDPLLIPNGCDAEWLAGARRTARPPDIQLPPPIVGVSGQLSTRMDLRAVEAVADRGHSVLLVGRLRQDLPAEAVEPLLRRPNVQWVGFRPYEELPGYLGAMDVGLVPYTDTEFNRASFPLKILEYLAAGLPVVASDLPILRWLDTDLIRAAPDPQSFADAVDEALAEAHDPALVAERQGFAAAHSWRSRAAAYAQALADREQLEVAT